MRPKYEVAFRALWAGLEVETSMGILRLFQPGEVVVILESVELQAVEFDVPVLMLKRHLYRNTKEEPFWMCADDLIGVSSACELFNELSDDYIMDLCTGMALKELNKRRR